MCLKNKINIYFSFFRFNCYNIARSSELVPSGAQLPDDELFARPPDLRNPRVC